jgi:hypothetical protein
LTLTSNQIIREIETDELRPAGKPRRVFSCAAANRDEAPHPSTSNQQQRMHHMPFEKGQSGNPAGRPPGARNKATIMAELLLQGEAEAMTRLAIEQAKAGDMAALRMCLERLVPPCKHRTIEFELPRLASAADAVSAMAAITAGVAVGDLTAAEAADLSGLVDRFVGVLETAVLERRVARLEREADRPIPEVDRNDQRNQVPHADQGNAKDLYNFGDAP